MEERTRKAWKYIFWGLVVLVVVAGIAHITGLVNLKELYEDVKKKVKDSIDAILAPWKE